MDILYIVRHGNWNPELKLSLRSLRNIPHSRVFIAGYTPEWCKNVISIPVKQGAERFYNTTKNIKAACKDKRLSDTFILMNDDIYINVPMDMIPVYHRGPLTHIDKPLGAYQNQRNQAVAFLKEQGIDNPLNYDLHIPMPVNKKNMLEIIKLMKDRGHSHKRSIYGNLHNIGGRYMDDVKIHNQDKTFVEDQFFLSSNKDAITHGPLGKYLKEKFKEKCEYEI